VADASGSDKTSTVLFVCVHNAGRSQMASALLEAAAGETVRVLSAGSEPADQIHPPVVEVMREVGIDLAEKRPHLLADKDVQAADVVVTMGCGDACPVYPGKRYLDWELPDPAGNRSTRYEASGTRSTAGYVLSWPNSFPARCRTDNSARCGHAFPHVGARKHSVQLEVLWEQEAGGSNPPAPTPAFERRFGLQISPARKVSAFLLRVWRKMLPPPPRRECIPRWGEPRLTPVPFPGPDREPADMASRSVTQRRCYDAPGSAGVAQW
jgi:arsenate reductase